MKKNKNKISFSDLGSLIETHTVEKNNAPAEQKEIENLVLELKPGAWLSYSSVGSTYAAQIESMETPLMGWKWTGIPDKRGVWIKMFGRFETWKEGRDCLWEYEIYKENSRYKLISPEDGMRIRTATIGQLELCRQMVFDGIGKNIVIGGGSGWTGRTADQLEINGSESSQENDRDGFLSPNYD